MTATLGHHFRRFFSFMDISIKIYGSLRILSLFFIVCLSGVAHAQEASINHEDLLIDSDVNPGQVLSELRPAPSGVVGTVYYDEQWQNGTIYLTNKRVIRDRDMRYNVMQNYVEVKTTDGVRACPYDKIDRFELLTKQNLPRPTTFINTNNFKFEDNIPVLGFFEVIEGGKIPVYSLSKSELIAPSYVPAFDMGRKENKLVLHRKLLCVERR